MKIVKDGVEVASYDRCTKDHTFTDVGNYEVLCGVDNQPATSSCRTSVEASAPTIPSTGPRSVFLVLLAIIAGSGAYFARRRRV